MERKTYELALPGDGPRLRMDTRIARLCALLERRRETCGDRTESMRDGGG